MNFFAKVAFWEGVSYLVLLFVAMPLKYQFDKPETVRIVGMAHGVLFVLFCVVLTGLLSKKKLKFSFSAFAFVMSLVPFGTFYLDKKLKEMDK